MKKNKWMFVVMVLVILLGSCTQPVQPTKGPVQPTAVLTPPTKQPVQPTEQLRSQSELFWVEKERLWKESEDMLEDLPSLDCGELGEFRPEMSSVVNKYIYSIEPDEIPTQGGSCTLMVPDDYYAQWVQWNRNSLIFVNGVRAFIPDFYTLGTGYDYDYATVYGESRLTGEIRLEWKENEFTYSDSPFITVQKQDPNQPIPSWPELKKVWEEDKEIMEELPLLDCGKFGLYRPYMIDIGKYQYKLNSKYKIGGELTLEDLFIQGGSCTYIVHDEYYANWIQDGGNSFVDGIQLPIDPYNASTLYGESRLTGKIVAEWKPNEFDCFARLYITVQKQDPNQPILSWPEQKRLWEESKAITKTLPLLDCNKFGSFKPEMVDIHEYRYRFYENNHIEGELTFDDFEMQGGSCTLTIPDEYYVTLKQYECGTTFVNGVRAFVPGPYTPRTRCDYNENYMAYGIGNDDCSYTRVYGEIRLTGKLQIEWGENEGMKSYTFIRLRKQKDNESIPSWQELQKIWKEERDVIKTLPSLDCGKFGVYRPYIVDIGIYQYGLSRGPHYQRSEYQNEGNLLLRDLLTQGGTCTLTVPNGYYAKLLQWNGNSFVNGREITIDPYDPSKLYGETHLIGTIVSKYEANSEAMSIHITLYKDE